MLKKFVYSTFIVLFCVLTATSVFSQTTAALEPFNKGNDFLAARKYEEALAAFRLSAQADPKFPGAHINAGITLILLNRGDEAIVEFKEAVRLAPADARVRRPLCKALTDNKKYSEAIEQCRETIRLDPALNEADAYLALALFKSKQIDESFAVLSGALAKFANDERLLNLAGQLYMDAGQFGSALGYYETLSQLFPRNNLYQVKLAQCYLRTERDSEAVAAANKVIQADPKNSEAYYILGRVYFEIGYNDESLAAFQRSAELGPNNSDAFYLLGKTQERMGKPGEAISSLRKAVSLSPDDWSYNYELGETFSSNGRFEDAIPPLRKADSLLPDDFQTKVSFGLALMESAHYDEALQVLSKADQMKPNNEIVTMFLNVARSRRDGASRLEEIKKKVADQRSIEGLLALGGIYGYLRRPAEAEPLLLEALKLRPNDWELYNYIGVFYSDAGEQEKAIAAFSKAIELKTPPHQTLYLSLGDKLERVGRINDALAAFQKAYAIKSDSFAVLKFYGDFLVRTGNRQEAIRIYQQALSIEPLNSAVLVNLGILYIRVSNVNGARQCLETLKVADPVEAKKLLRCMKFRALL